MNSYERSQYLRQNHDRIRDFIQHQLTLTHSYCLIFVRTCTEFNFDSSTVEQINASFEILKHPFSIHNSLAGYSCHSAILHQIENELRPMVEKIVKEKFGEIGNKFGVFCCLCKELDEPLVPETKFNEWYDAKLMISPMQELRHVIRQTHQMFIQIISYEFEETLIPRLVKDQFRFLTHERSQIFINICQLLKYEPVPKSLIENWYRNGHNLEWYSKNYYPMPPCYHQLLKSVSKSWYILTNGILWGKRHDFFLTSYLHNNSRYAMMCPDENQNKHVKFIDTFHGETRNISITGVPEYFGEGDNGFKVIFFNHKYLIINDGDRRDISLYLCKIDWNTMKCRVLNFYDMEHEAIRLVFDKQNEDKFLLVCRNDRRGSAFMGQIDEKEEKLTVNDKELLDLGENSLFALKLDGKKVYGFRREYEANNFKGIGYYESDLKSGTVPSIVKICKFKSECGCHLADLTNYKWLDDVCHFIGASTCHSVILNTKTQQLLIINFISCSFFFEIALDLDGVLVVSDYENVMRIPLRKPELLLNLTWFEIRRQEMFDKSKCLYKKAMNQLPLNSELQPLNIKF